MKVLATAVWLVVLASVHVSAQRRRVQTAADLEPPRPEGHISLLGHPTEPRNNRARGGRQFDIRSTASTPITYHPRGGTKTPPTGKTQYISHSKTVPESKPIYQAEPSEKAEQVATEEKGIKCTKIDKAKILLDDVVKGRFKRDTSMTCYKCEDLKKGGTYEKCTSGDDPKNKAYFESHSKSYSSKDKPKSFKFGPESDEEAESTIVDTKYNPSPSKEYLLAAGSIGKYYYGEPTFSSSERFEIPASLYAKSRGKATDHTAKPSEYKFTTSKENKEPRINYEHHDYSQGESSPQKSENRHSPKSSEYSYSTYKEEPKQSYSYKTTDPPTSYTYKTEDGDSGSYGSGDKSSGSYGGGGDKSSGSYGGGDKSSPSEDAYKSTPTEYSFSSKKVQPTRSYSYESTDKPIKYSYRTEKADGSDAPAQYETPDYDKYSPKSTDYSFSKSVENPLKSYHESSSYGDDEPKVSKTGSYHSSESETKDPDHAPQIKEYSSSFSHDAPQTYASQPSDELKRALGEFHQKDRSHCKKVNKEKMTCWQCVDKTGAKHEECMYVASSEPKVHKAAYSNVKETTQRPTARHADSHIEKSDVKQVVAAPHREQSRRTRSRPVENPEPISDFRAAARSESREALAALRSGDVRSRRGEERGRDNQEHRQRSNPVASATQEKESRPEPPAKKFNQYKPEDFEPEGPEGAYSAETEERFDKKLGLTLPAYMLERSVHEANFDEAVRSGR